LNKKESWRNVKKYALPAFGGALYIHSFFSNKSEYFKDKFEAEAI
jgi:hypothetical protein